MKRILLFLVLVSSFCGYSQTTVYWRADGPSDGSWLSGSTCEPSGDGQWFYNSWGGFRQAPDCFDSHDVYFSGNGINTMKLNTRDFNVRRLFFTSNASSQRILNADSNYRLFLNANNGVPKIENNSGTRHVFNAPITLNAGAELNPVDGDLDFDFIDNNSNSIDVYGDNGKVIRFLNVISGSGALRIKQYSIAKLSALNTYTGNTEIDEGELWIENGGDIASGSAIYLGNGGQLGNFTKFFLSKSDGGTNFTRTINVNPGNVNTRYIGGLNASGTNTFSGNIVRNSNQPLNIEVVNAGGNVTFSGVINGSGTVTKVGNGTATFTGNNTYTGATAVTAGTLIVQKSGYAATITTSGIAVAFSSAPTRGTYTVLPGALSSSATLSTSGLGFGQTASFNASTGVLTVFDAPTVSLVSNDIDNSFCAGTSVTFTATANQVGGGTVNYDFKVAGGSVQSGASSTYTTTSLTDGQVVTVEITVTGGTYLSSTTATSNSIVNTVITPQLWYLDADNDGYYTGSGQSSCVSPGLGYKTTVLGGGDCDDANPIRNPGLVEKCWNNIDDNCSGVMSEGCVPVVINMATANNYTLPNFAIAVSAHGYTFSGATTTAYRFTITNNTTLTTVEVPSPTRFVTIPNAMRTYNSTYTIAAAAVIDGEEVPYAGNSIVVNSPVISKIKLAPTSCDVQVSTLSATISANPGLNATGYRFRLRLTSDNGVTPTYYYATPTGRFTTLSSFVGFTPQYNSSYTIDVEYSFLDVSNANAVTWSGFGDTCTITTPAIPTIGLSSPICGSLTPVTSKNATISANPALYALKYQFRLRLTSDNGPTPTYYATPELTSRFSTLGSFIGLTVAYNAEYTISVRYKVMSNGEEAWSSYGSECAILSPIFPETSLTEAFCNESANTLDQVIEIIPVSGATAYVVYLYEGDDLVDSETVTSPQFTLSMFNGVTAPTNYTVQVAVKIGTVEGNKDRGCSISSIENAMVARMAQVPFAVKAYPNPYSNAFQLDVTSTDKTASIDVKVFDMLGRMVDSRNTTAGDLETATIGSDYPSGVYNVIVTQGDETKVVRVVKR